MAPPTGRSEALSSRPRPGIPRGSRSSSARLGDLVFRLLCQAAAIIVVVLAVLLVVVLTWQSWLAMQTIGVHFFTQTTWDPEPDHRIFGSLAFVYGTVATSAIAMLLAVPLGIATAAYLSEIAPGWLRRPASFLVEMLAAIPSVVYGFWGLFVLSPYLQKLISWLGGPNTGGSGLLPAGIVLAIMIVPYVAAVGHDVCRAVPNSQRAAALALGATRWQMIWRVVLPYAQPGIVGGCFLALGRALGETMAVTMLIGNRPEIVLSPFAMADSIASVIANQFTAAPYELYRSALVELGLVLLLVNVVVNTFARALIRRVGRVRKEGLLARLARLTGVRRTPPEGTTAAAPDQRPRIVFGRNALAWWIDQLMTGMLGLALIITAGSLFLILSYLLYHGIGAVNWDFFVKLPAPVGEPGGGMANALYGSAMMVGLATLFAVPIGVLAAIYLAEYRSDWFGPSVRFIGELLAGVPSIVIGIFGYVVVVQPMGHFSGWAGAFALGVMMLPIVMRASEEALKLVPQSIRNASYALGASQYQTVGRVIVPAALPAIITAVFLAIARIGGETAPLLLTAGGNQYFPSSPNDFTPCLPVYIFNYATSSYPNWTRQAWAAALVLLALVMLLNVGIRSLTGKRALLASRAE